MKEQLGAQTSDLNQPLGFQGGECCWLVVGPGRSWSRRSTVCLTPRKQKRLWTLPKFVFGALQQKNVAPDGYVFIVQKRRFHPFTKSLVLLLWVHPCAPHVWHNEELQYSHQGRTLRQIFLLVMLPCKEDISHLQSTCISSQILCYMTYCTSYPNKNSTMQNVIHRLLFPKSLPESYPRFWSGLLPSRLVVGCFLQKKVIPDQIPRLGHLSWALPIFPNPTFPQKTSGFFLAVKKTAEARLFWGRNSKPYLFFFWAK